VEESRVDAEVPEVVRRVNVDAVVLEREKNRRVDEVRFGASKFVVAGERGGDMGPRTSFRR
jgi:hypothetical protein